MAARRRFLNETVESITQNLGGIRISEEGASVSESSPGAAIFTPVNSGGPLDEFFALYRDFDYNPAAPSTSEFERLSAHRGWRQRSKRSRKARAAFARASGEEFLWHLSREGTRSPRDSGESEHDEDGAEDVDSRPWRRICKILNLKTAAGFPPKSKTQCKKALGGIYINIYDFLDYLRNGGQLRRFQSLRALSGYSYPNKVYPKRAAKQHELLRFLLQQISSA